MSLKSLRYVYAALAILFSCASYAQRQVNAELRKGNKFFRDSVFKEADVWYRKALQKDSKNARAAYNLGTALLMQQKAEESMEMYEAAVKSNANPMLKAKAYHNMGVILQTRQLFADAIEAYKASLRLNPTDDETRYNLALCQKQLKNQPPQQQPKPQKQEQKQEEKQQKEQEQQSNPNEMSKDNAEQILQLSQQEDKQVQERLNKTNRIPVRARNKKNW